MIVAVVVTVAVKWCINFPGGGSLLLVGTWLLDCDGDCGTVTGWQLNTPVACDLFRGIGLLGGDGGDGGGLGKPTTLKKEIVASSLTTNNWETKSASRL